MSMNIHSSINSIFRSGPIILCTAIWSFCQSFAPN